MARDTLDRRLARLGYGSRHEVRALFAAGRVQDARGTRLDADDATPHVEIRLDGTPLDPPPGALIALHKPVDYTCSSKGAGKLVYDLVPARFRIRRPPIAPIGRLDRDTSGLLLLTDDGAVIHRLTHPKSKVTKCYEATLARPLRGDEAETFALGMLMLESESTPLLPATLEVLGDTEARLTIVEGRYHQVRRMFAAVGNHVLALRRVAIAGLTLGDQPSGSWRELTAEERALLGPAAV